MVVFIKLRKKRPINVGYLKRFPRFHSFFLSKNRKNERNTIMKAFLILEDGHVFEGKSIGSTDEIISEIVFNTSMTGYLEILTDPSYAGQSVCMTISAYRQLRCMQRGYGGWQTLVVTSHS